MYRRVQKNWFSFIILLFWYMFTSNSSSHLSCSVHLNLSLWIWLSGLICLTFRIRSLDIILSLFRRDLTFIVFQEELRIVCNSLFPDNYAAFPQWTVNASRDTFSVVVPTYFKVYESKKFLSSILKLYARRLARWFSCGKLIAECHSINNFTDLIRNG